ncbi:MAG: hypothetical protein IKR09_06090 [Alphaproteobacteria bacterium]|nr:hypothetical protein [Alphaproteobacteria bacterium]
MRKESLYFFVVSSGFGFSDGLGFPPHPHPIVVSVISTSIVVKRKIS